MNKFEHLVPPYMRALGSYVPGKTVKQAEAEAGVKCIKLASNENPFGPSPRALEAMRAAAAEANFYPETDVPDLRAALAARHGLQPEQVMVTAGSSTFLDIIARTLLAPGLKAITSERSFIVYPVVARAAGAQFVTVPTRNDGFDLDAIAAAVDSSTRLVFVANPNNPTGTVLDAAAIDRFLDRLPSQVVVVLDEAYTDFASYFAAQRGLEYSHSIEYVRQGRPVVVLRTFSKAHGLAGMRVGYGFAAAELIQYFSRLKPPFLVTGVGEAAALAALDDQEHIRRVVENNAAGAAYLTRELQQLGLRVVPTWANFLFVDMSEEALPTVKRLQQEGIIVRPMQGWGAPEAFRVTVGTPQQNEAFVRALKKVLTRAEVG